MDSTTWLIKNLNIFSSKFKYINIRYWYDESIYSHLIEVFPSYMKDSQEYIEEEVKLRLAFIKEFPFENIAFLSEDSSFSLDNIGVLFEKIITYRYSTVVNSAENNITMNVEVGDTIKINSNKLPGIQGIDFEKFTQNVNQKSPLEFEMAA